MKSIVNNYIMYIVSVSLFFVFSYSTQGQISTLFHRGDRVHQDSLTRIQSYNGTILTMPNFNESSFYLISRDSGITWQEMIFPGIEKSSYRDWGGDVKGVLIDPNSLKLLNDSIIVGQEWSISGTTNVFVLSTNYGRTWKIHTELKYVSDFACYEGKLYAITYEKIEVDSFGIYGRKRNAIIFESHNLGKSWTPIDTIITQGLVYKYARDNNALDHSINYDNINRLYLYIHNDSIWYISSGFRLEDTYRYGVGLLSHTADRGKSWGNTSFDAKIGGLSSPWVGVPPRFEASYISNDTIYMNEFISKAGISIFNEFKIPRSSNSYFYEFYFTGKYWTNGLQYYEGISNIKNLSFEVSDSVAKMFYYPHLSGLPNNVWYRYDDHLPTVSSGVTWLGTSGVCIYIKHGASVHRMENHGIPK